MHYHKSCNGILAHEKTHDILAEIVARIILCSTVNKEYSHSFNDFYGVQCPVYTLTDTGIGSGMTSTVLDEVMRASIQLQCIFSYTILANPEVEPHAPNTYNQN